MDYFGFVWIILNYVRLLEEMLTIDYFAMLGVGFLASIELNCQTTFTEARTQDSFSRLWPLFLQSLRQSNSVLSFLTAGTTLKGTRNQYFFPEF
jgi:hypothetical protein